MNRGQAYAERYQRGLEVAATYAIEHVGAQSYVLWHPTEDDGCAYLVDLLRGTCNCPDYWGFCQERNLQCKHLWAAEGLWHKDYREAVQAFAGPRTEPVIETMPAGGEAPTLPPQDHNPYDY